MHRLVWLIDQALADDDSRALTPLIHSHVYPYGTFELDTKKRLPLDAPVELPVQCRLFTKRA